MIFKIEILVSLIFFIQINSETQVPCNSYTCPDRAGECVEDICLCGPGYTTVETTSNNMALSQIDPNDGQNFYYCNYVFKYKDYASYFEAILPFGVGHFYTLRFFHGFIKFILFYFISVNKIIFKKRIKTIKGMEALVNIVMWIFFPLYFIDYLGFSFGYYKDGNGMILL